MLNGLSLFSGIGGLDVALSEYVRPIAYCEIDTYCQGILFSRMADKSLHSAPICTDVKSLNGSDFNGPDIDIIYGGSPCQDISVAGRGRGLAGERSGLYWEIHRLAKEIRPPFIFLENVPAICTKGGWDVVSSLAEMGYDCRWCVISAASVGALHRRERWFLLAHSQDNRKGRELRNLSKTNDEFAKSQKSGKEESKQSGDASGISPDVAHASGERRQQIGGSAPCDESENEGRPEENDNQPECGSEDVAHSSITRLEGQRAGASSPSEEESLSTSGGADAVREWREAVSSVRRVTDGVSAELDLLIFVCEGMDEQGYKESDNPKTISEIDLFNREMLRAMWFNRELATTSSQDYFGRLFNLVPNMPQRHSFGRTFMGTWIQEGNELYNLWEKFYSSTEQIEQALWQSRLLENLWEIKCREKVEKDYRVDRIKCLGNSVCPIQAKTAFETLMGLG